MNLKWTYLVLISSIFCVDYVCGVQREFNKAFTWCKQHNLVKKDVVGDIWYIQQYKDQSCNDDEILTVFLEYLNQSSKLLKKFFQDETSSSNTVTYKMPAHFQDSMFSSERYIWQNFAEYVFGRDVYYVSQESVVYVYLTAAAIVDELTILADSAKLQQKNDDFVFTCDYGLTQ